MLKNEQRLVSFYDRPGKYYLCFLSGNKYIFLFLLGLRILAQNGAVTVTWEQVDYTANDIRVEKGTEYVKGDNFDISIKIKPSNSIMTVVQV